MITLIYLIVTAAIALFLKLLAGHILMDYPLQGEFMAKYKNRHSFRPPQCGRITWVLMLSAHAFMHAMAVWFITNSAIFGCMEFVFHWLIDFFKCESKYGLVTDQMLHVLCKIMYVAITVVLTIYALSNIYSTLGR